MKKLKKLIMLFAFVIGFLLAVNSAYAATQMKTVEFYINNSAPLALAANAWWNSTFLINLTESSISVKSAYIEITQNSPTGTAYNENVYINGTSVGIYVVPSGSEWFGYTFIVNGTNKTTAPTGLLYGLSQGTLGFNLSILTSKLSGVIREFSQTFTTNTVVERFSSLTRIFTNTPSLTQITSRLSTLSRMFTLQTSLTDILSRQFGKLTGAIQQFSLVNLVQRNLGANLQLTNTFLLTEITARLSALTRSFTNTFSLTNIGDRISSLTRTFTNAFSLTNIAGTLSGVIRNVSNAFSFTDVTERIANLTRSFANTFSLTEISTRLSTLTRSFTNLFSLSDLTGRFSGVTRTFANSFTLSDLVQRIFGRSPQLTNTFSLASITGRLAGLIRFFTEGMTATTDLARTAGISRMVTNAIQFILQLLRAFAEFVAPPSETPITPSASPQPGGSTGGITAITPEPIVQPATTVSEFVHTPILREMVAGESSFDQITVKSKSNEIVKNLAVDVIGIPQSWVKITPEKIDLLPGEQETFKLEINVPEGITLVDYKVVVVLKNGVVEDKNIFMLRVKGKTETEKVVSRGVTLLGEENKVLVDLKIKPKEDTPAMMVKEEVPKNLAQNVKDIEFITPPDEIIKADPLFAWVLANLTANEDRKLSYTLKGVPTDLTSLFFFPINEFLVVKQELPVGLKISEIKMPTFYIGEKSTMAVVIENIDSKEHALNLSYNLPSSWKATPEKISGIILTGERKEFVISLEVPEQEIVTRKIVSLIFEWDGSLFVREYNIIVARRIVVDILIYLGIAVAVVAVSIKLVNIYRERRTEYYSYNRLGNLLKIRDLIRRRNQYRYKYRE